MSPVFEILNTECFHIEAEDEDAALEIFLGSDQAELQEFYVDTPNREISEADA